MVLLYMFVPLWSWSGCNSGLCWLLVFVPKQVRISFHAGGCQTAVKGTLTAVLCITESYKHQGVSWSLNKHSEILSLLGLLPRNQRRQDF